MPKIHVFEDSGEAYDSSQCWDEIKDGDVLSVPSERVVGILIEAWPISISENAGNFHVLKDAENFDWAAVLTTESGWTETRDYSKSFDMATDELARICLEAVKERWNL